MWVCCVRHQFSALPTTVGSLVGLQKLVLNSCSGLRMLHPHFSTLTSLQELDLAGCVKLAKLPAKFDNLSNLQKLDLSYCKLTSLPGSFSKLSCLQAVSLSESCATEAAKAKRQLNGGSRDVYVSINCPLWAAPTIPHELPPPEVARDSQLSTTLRSVLRLASVSSASPSCFQCCALLQPALSKSWRA